MIPRDYITEWRSQAPWVENFQVEQDLVICRALVSIFNHPILAESLAFRGGTALYKLHLKPPARYSEDIDLVQVNAEPAGAVMDALREVLDSWLGKPQWKQTDGRVTCVYRFDSEDSPPLRMRLKIEINSREHFSVYGIVHEPFAISSRWFRGVCTVSTYSLNELIGTKLRALYQRKKGRDLFDLAVALQHGALDPNRVVEAFSRYMKHGSHSVTRAQFEQNLTAKSIDPQFSADIGPLLSADYKWDIDSAISAVKNQLIELLPGEPWKGDR